MLKYVSKLKISFSLFSSVEPGWQRVVQVDLEVDGVGGTVGSRSISWAVEYPGIRAGAEETETRIHLAQKDLVGIVPLAMVRETAFLLFLGPVGLFRGCWHRKIKDMGSHASWGMLIQHKKHCYSKPD